MKVLKFGGSSLADAGQFQKVKNIVEADDQRQYIVVSAPGKGKDNEHKVTDLLIMCNQLADHELEIDDVYDNIRETFGSIVKGLKIDIDIESLLDQIYEEILDGASRDYTVSRGEFLNAQILAKYLGWDFIDSKELVFFKKGKLDQDKTDQALKDALINNSHVVIPGFYGSDEEGKIKTFSRGGSDVSGSLVAKALDADLYENWTDVSGFLVASPQIVPDAEPIGELTYTELRELSYMGAPVLHEDSVFPVREKNIPINIKNTNDPAAQGTTIIQEETVEQKGITGIAGSKDYSVVNIHKDYLNTEIGVLRKIASVFETNGISIEHMPSSVDTVSVIVATEDLHKKKDKVVEELKVFTKADNITVEDGLAIIAVVGRGLKGYKGASGKIFTALGQADVNIVMITQGSSELNIIFGVKNEDFDKAIEAIYYAFYE